MRKGILFTCLLLIVGCSMAQKKEVQKENTPQPNPVESVATNNKEQEKHAFTLEEHLFGSMQIIASNDLSEEDEKLVTDLAKKADETPEIVLFLITSEADGYSEREVKNFMKNIPPRFIKRDDCEKEYTSFEVFQTITDEKKREPIAALANGFRNGYYTGTVFFISRHSLGRENILLYDGLKIVPKNHECVTFKDTFTYESKGNGEKTVPVLFIFPNNTKINPDYEDWERLFIHKFTISHNVTENNK